MIGASGYDLIIDDAPPLWTTNNTYTPRGDFTSVTLVAWGLPADLNGYTFSCENPASEFNCDSAAGVLNWTDLDASGYDIFLDGGSPFWVTSTSYQPAVAYETAVITAWGLPPESNGRSTTCVA